MQFLALMLCSLFGVYLGFNGIYYNSLQFWLGLALFLAYGLVRKLEK